MHMFSILRNAKMTFIGDPGSLDRGDTNVCTYRFLHTILIAICVWFKEQFINKQKVLFNPTFEKAYVILFFNSIKVTHNTCSLHLVSNFQNSSKHTQPSIENITSLW